ncbi:MAG TPA: hypothetical protein VN253_08660, partial [Kofleriaceae bacterium]|nr:hypothetical protein [Kofleriaceae bacterium]
MNPVTGAAHDGTLAAWCLRAAGALALVTAGTACGDSPPPAFDVTIGCTAATSWTFPDTALGQTASVILLATRTDEGDPDPVSVELALDGPDAAAFHVVPDGTSCGGGALAPGDTCVALIEFTPAAEGLREASLHLGKTAIALGATATAPQGLVASIRNATVIHGFYNVASNHTVRL